MSLIHADCFGPGLPPGGEKVAVVLEKEGLLLWSGEPRELRVPYEQIQVAAGGFDHDQMILTWAGETGPWSLVLSDIGSKQQFVLHAPPSLSSRLSEWKKEVTGIRRRMHLGRFALGLAFLAPILLAVLLWVQSDYILDWIVEGISIESEEKLGHLIYEQTRASLKLIPSGDIVKAIEDIGGRLAEGSPYRFHWHVAEDAAVNAFAIPGGHVVVLTGLVRAADSAEEVAGVLAHEIEHVLQRHSLKGMVRQVGWKAALHLVMGGLGGGALEALAAELGTLKFGRDQESEADQKGVLLLKKARINPEGMIVFFEKLEKGEGGMRIPLLLTHPGSADRAASLKAIIREIGPWKGFPLPYDWNKIKEGLSPQAKG